MLPKHQRLTDSRDFQRVYKKGSFFSAPLLSINWMPNRTKGSRIGVVVGKKISAKATDRNTLKRRYREAIRALFDDIPKGLDVVIVIKEKSKGVSFSEIEKEMVLVVKNLKAQNEKNNH